MNEPLTIGTGGLNPSNRSDPGTTGNDAKFPNLAMRYDSEDESPETRERLKALDIQIEVELKEAGIEVHSLSVLRGIKIANEKNHPESSSDELAEVRANGEVPTQHLGQLGSWGFSRAWYYWIATGPGIPPEDAKRLHDKNGHACRVDGHAGAPDPIEHCRGFAVGCYHVDTQNGLNALANTIREVLERNGPSEEEEGKD